LKLSNRSSRCSPALVLATVDRSQSAAVEPDRQDAPGTVADDDDEFIGDNQRHIAATLHMLAAAATDDSKLMQPAAAAADRKTRAAC